MSFSWSVLQVIRGCGLSCQARYDMAQTTSNIRLLPTIQNCGKTTMQPTIVKTVLLHKLQLLLIIKPLLVRHQQQSRWSKPKIIDSRLLCSNSVLILANQTDRRNDQTTLSICTIARAAWKSLMTFLCLLIHQANISQYGCYLVTVKEIVCLSDI